jgi:hypothetical protein
VLSNWSMTVHQMVRRRIYHIYVYITNWKCNINCDCQKSVQSKYTSMLTGYIFNNSQAECYENWVIPTWPCRSCSGPQLPKFWETLSRGTSSGNVRYTEERTILPMQHWRLLLSLSGPVWSQWCLRLVGFYMNDIMTNRQTLPLLDFIYIRVCVCVCVLNEPSVCKYTCTFKITLCYLFHKNSDFVRRLMY